jgi:hypothetical protein
MEATVDPQPRGPDWMPITPKTGSLFHAETQTAQESQKVAACMSTDRDVAGHGAFQRSTTRRFATVSP